MRELIVDMSRRFLRVFSLLSIFSFVGILNLLSVTEIFAVEPSRYTASRDKNHRSSYIVVEGRMGDVEEIVTNQIGPILQEVKANNYDEDPVLSGGEVRFLKNEATDSQQLSAIFRSSDGKVIVVDGGVSEDRDHLLDTIVEFGGHVDAWLVTHPHSDHVGVLTDVLEDARIDAPSGETIIDYGQDMITVADYYYSVFEDDSWYDTYDKSEAGSAWAFKKALKNVPAERKHNGLYAGCRIALSENLSFTVINESIQINDTFAGNSAGIIYNICIDGIHFLMLGDMSFNGGDLLLNYGLLDGVMCDYVQIAHHGQAGVSDAFYEALSPEYCIWPTNEYVFYAAEGSTSSLSTEKTKACIASLSSVVANYVTLDADVVIR